MAGDRVRRLVRVTGRVQGVWFRAHTEELARSLGVSGWVRNRPDGAVEAEFEGERGAVDEIVRWCRHGPSRARVDDVQVVERPLAGDSGFSVR